MLIGIVDVIMRFVRNLGEEFAFAEFNAEIQALQYH